MQRDARNIPPLATYRSDLRDICVERGGYPHAWRRLESCPCCEADTLHFAFERDGFRHERCGACGFHFLNPVPPEAVLKALYDGPFHVALREHVEVPLARKGLGFAPFQFPVEMIRKAVEATAQTGEGRWLDVGGGIGTTAAFIRQIRPGWSVFLNELGEHARELAQELFHVNVVHESLAVLAQLPERYDVVSLVAVLEHVPEPKNLLNSCLDILRPGGALMLCVPRFSDLNAAVSKSEAPAVTPPFHVNLFHERNLENLLHRTGKVAQNIEMSVGGTRAFSLIHHIPTAEYWDMTFPTADSPSVRAFKLREYPLELAVRLNALDAADKAMDDYFFAHDGGMLMTLIARRL